MMRYCQLFWSFGVVRTSLVSGCCIFLITLKMLANTSVIPSNFSSLLFLKNKKVNTRISFPNSAKIKNPKTHFFKNSIYNYNYINTKISVFGKKGRLYICHSSLNFQNQEDPIMEKDTDVSNEVSGGSNNGASGGDQWDWTTSFLLFGLWGGLMYYVFFLAPNQTPVSHRIFLLNILFSCFFRLKVMFFAYFYIDNYRVIVYSLCEA